MENLEKGYDREKTLAVLTGIVCVLVFLAGTALGGYHAFSVVGAFAGLLALASYGLADVAVAWGSYIDYKESGGPMEWTAWAVKYILSFYLLFSGGCIAYTLFYTSEGSASRAEVQQRASKAQSECLGASGSQRGRNQACQKVYDSTFEAGMAEIAKKTEGESSAETSIKKFIAFPLFHYLPGILGLLGILAFTLVSKIVSPPRHEFTDSQVLSVQKAVRGRVHSAPLRVSSPRKSSSVTNGSGAFLSVKRNAIRFRVTGQNERHVTHVSDAEASVLESFTYEELAREAVERREARHGKDELCVEIEQTL